MGRGEATRFENLVPARRRQAILEAFDRGFDTASIAKMAGDKEYRIERELHAGLDSRRAPKVVQVAGDKRASLPDRPRNVGPETGPGATRRRDAGEPALFQAAHPPR